MCMVLALLPALTTYAMSDSGGTSAGGQCGDNLYWSYSNGTLEIYGTGDMWDYSGNYPNGPNYAPWSYWGYTGEMRTIVIEEGITSIGNNAFYTMKRVGGNITIPYGVTRIGNVAFRLCLELKSLSIPSTVTQIGYYAFSECWKLDTIEFEGSRSLWNNISKGSAIFNGTNAHLTFNQSYTDIPVKSIELNATAITLKPDWTYVLQARCFPQNTTHKKISWHSSNDSVATINQNGWITAKSVGTTTITAKSSNGEYATCKVTVEEQKVINNYDDFKYRFGNGGYSLGYYYYENGKYVDNYHIPPERYMQIGYSKPKAYLKSLSEWEGSCFGMSASSILFYKNVMKEQNYGVDTISEFPTAIRSQTDINQIKLRKMLELLQISQDLDPYEPDFSPYAVAKELDCGNPVMFGLKSKRGNHAVVIYSYTKDSDGLYTFYIYDCSKFVTQLLWINDSYNFIYEEEEDRIYYDFKPNIYCTYETLKSLHDKIKYENNNNAASLFSLRNEPTYTYIIRPIDDLTITSSSGQTSTIIDGDTAGDIEDIRVVPSSYLAENPTYTIILPTDTYTITGTSDDVVTTALADDYMSTEITAKSSTPVTISSDLKDITVNTVANDDYNIKYTTYDNIFDEMSLTGTAIGTVTSSLNETNVAISGVNTVSTAATVSNSPVNASAENLAECDSITINCEETDSGATLQILAETEELTEKTALPEREAVAAPTYDLGSGEYSEAQQLTFTKDDDTIIYYTTDGSIPSADNRNIYTMPIDINKSMTLKAVATKYGYTDSEIVELTYTLPEAYIPESNISSGEYSDIQVIELTTGDLEDKIYYTLDGSDPFLDGIEYTTPITLTEDTYLQAYSVKNGCVSDVAEYEYIITPESPFYFSNSIATQDNEILTEDNIKTLTSIKLTLTRLGDGEHSGLFLLAMYDANGKFVGAKFKTATISEEIQQVEIPISEDISSVHKIKVFSINSLSGLEALCEPLNDTVSDVLAET